MQLFYQFSLRFLKIVKSCKSIVKVWKAFCKIL